MLRGDAVRPVGPAALVRDGPGFAFSVSGSRR